MGESPTSYLKSWQVVTSSGANDFSLRQLYEALDERRRARGLSWAAASHEISGFGLDRRAIASSTITGIGTKRVAEGNGVLHMLAWLDRPPDSGASVGTRSL